MPLLGGLGAGAAAEGGEEGSKPCRAGQRAGCSQAGRRAADTGSSEITGLSLSTEITSVQESSWRQKN